MEQQSSTRSEVTTSTTSSPNTCPLERKLYCILKNDPFARDSLMLASTRVESLLRHRELGIESPSRPNLASRGKYLMRVTPVEVIYHKREDI